MGYRDVRKWVGCALAVAKLVRKPAKSAQRLLAPRHMWHWVLANVLVPRRDARLSGRTKFSNTESTKKLLLHFTMTSRTKRHHRTPPKHGRVKIIWNHVNVLWQLSKDNIACQSIKYRLLIDSYSMSACHPSFFVHEMEQWNRTNRLCNCDKEKVCCSKWHPCTPRERERHADIDELVCSLSFSINHAFKSWINMNQIMFSRCFSWCFHALDRCFQSYPPSWDTQTVSATAEKGAAMAPSTVSIVSFQDVSCVFRILSLPFHLEYSGSCVVHRFVIEKYVSTAA